jgi:hypothetical protein
MYWRRSQCIIFYYVEHTYFFFCGAALSQEHTVLRGVSVARPLRSRRPVVPILVSADTQGMLLRFRTTGSVSLTPGRLSPLPLYSSRRPTLTLSTTADRLLRSLFSGSIAVSARGALSFVEPCTRQMALATSHCDLLR